MEQLSAINREYFKSVDLQFLECYVASGGSEHLFAVSGPVRAGAVAVCRTFAITHTSPLALFAKSDPEYAEHFLSVSTCREPKKPIPVVRPSTEVPSRPYAQLLSIHARI